MLDDAIFDFEGIPWPPGDENLELRRHDVQSLRDVFSDHFLLFASVPGHFIRLKRRFDPFQMTREALARPGQTFAIKLSGVMFDVGSDLSDAGLDLLSMPINLQSQCIPEGLRTNEFDDRTRKYGLR